MTAPDHRLPNEARSIKGLANARATGRVLNLHLLAQDGGTAIADCGEKRDGLFHRQALNRAIIVKHNVRESEHVRFDGRRVTATKIILPADPDNLVAGATSFMLGERKAGRILKDILSIEKNSDDPGVKRDIQVLTIFDELPTLDPFIVRERFALEGIQFPDAFFSLRTGEGGNLHKYLRAQLAPLHRIADGGRAGSTAGRTLEQFLAALFAGTQSDIVDPLRQALNIGEGDWPAAMYALKAVLFYEYKNAQFQPRYRRFNDTLTAARIYGYSALAPAEIVLRRRFDLLERASEVKEGLDAFFESFAHAYRKELLGEGNVGAFQEYLTELDDRLYEYGVLNGMLEQIVGYWEYWHVARGGKSVQAEFFLGLCSGLLPPVDGGVRTCPDVQASL
jgi:hypothetical protein